MWKHKIPHNSPPQRSGQVGVVQWVPQPAVVPDVVRGRLEGPSEPQVSIFPHFFPRATYVLLTRWWWWRKVHDGEVLLYGETPSTERAERSYGATELVRHIWRRRRTASPGMLAECKFATQAPCASLHVVEGEGRVYSGGLSTV